MKGLNFFKEISHEQRSLLGFGTALILLLTLMFFAFLPMMQEALLAKEQLVNLEKRLEMYQELSENKNYFKEIKVQKEKLQCLEKRLPKNLKQEDIMKDLYASAKEKAVKVSLLKQIGQKSSNKQGITLYLECSGAYENVLKFLATVENEGSLKSLKEVTVKGNEANGILTVATTMTAYKK